MLKMHTYLAMGILGLLLTGCGFQLRSDARLPPQMSQTSLVIADEYSLFARRIRVLLQQAGVEIVARDKASAILEIPQNDVLTEVLTVGDNARVREYRISHTIQYRLLAADGSEIIALQTIRQAREISFDEQRILAISRETEHVKKDLAETISRLLLSRLQVVGSQS